MLKVFRENIFLPIARRIGTITAALLIGYGINEPLANEIAVGVAALGAVIGDLVVDWLDRRGR